MFNVYLITKIGIIKFNQSEEKTNLKFSELDFNWSKSNPISISSLIRA